MPKIWHGILAVLPVLLAPPLCAQSVYKIEGFSAPQVRPQTLTAELEAQLRGLQGEIDARSKSFTLSQALEMGLLNSPQLAATYAEIQGQQWNLVAVRRQWYPTLSASSEPFVPGRRFGSSNSTFRDGAQVDVPVF